MSALGLKIIDESVQQANVWINEVDYRAGWANKQRAYRLMRAVLQALRDHLSPDEAAQLSAQLPIFVRGIYYEGYDPSKTPVVERSKAGFIERVQAAFQGDPMGDAEHAIGAVFDVLDAHVSEGEMAHVRASFTGEIRALFADG
ncbi:DUF2267 domain-containing protein [Roseibacterium sp. SDUM158016]|jgi:uncharacterized protein (DUF2267 family)|uniref:DUF2267 domain-containing protein n=1 Tax=Roseicyclus sediminis TaxID=2980997 RepID=UPI0021D3E76E|nr:DUF2267 domain-containing protein [Roseibacterium sp. SDUM158016]MCU4654769.1 DUF2267 domain-containing protein [Roseibacterium sp. SDUM158016]